MTQSVEKHIPSIIRHYGMAPNDYQVEPIGSGHIHYTFKLKGSKSYILQRVNKNVFKEPEIIASNLRIASDYLKNNFPDFLFLSAIETTDHRQMVYGEDGFPWRMFPYFENTFTIDKVSGEAEAGSAAAEFARLTRYLEGIDTSLFKPTIPRFHDLGWRWEQLEAALKNTTPERSQQAADAIEQARKFSYLVDQYKDLVTSRALKLRITHNDTKINNILFDSTTGKAVCAVDLDTLMPGYFIYDVGDMIRTFVSPVDEEEKDTGKVTVRINIYNALIDGYLSQMKDHLNAAEKNAIPFSGMMMTYIMAIRMLADFLNGDVYYHTTYPGQNLVRASNQLKLLQELSLLK
jgi:Ser/Thr protein kinase RdoA (MazF antagonist)